MARSYSLVHMQPGWRQIQWEPIKTRKPALIILFTLGFAAHCSYTDMQKKAYNDAKDAEIFKWKRQHGLLTEGYVNHYARALNKQ